MLEHAPKKALFEAIYSKEGDIIFRFCRARVSGREQALDLTQETFVRLWQTLMSGKVISNERAFLFTVAHRLIIDWYRKKKTISLEHVFQGVANVDDEAYDPSDDNQRVDHELGADARFALAKIQELEPVYRDPVYLRFVEGLPPAAVSKILKISVNVASVRIHRGIKKLQQLLHHDPPTI